MNTFTRVKTDDAVGNRTSVVTTVSGSTTTDTYTPNGLNQYTSVQMPGGTRTPSYDTNGNLASVTHSGGSRPEGTRTFSYDGLNRLTGTVQTGPYYNVVDAPSGTQDEQIYYYDARNRCVARVVKKWTFDWTHSPDQNYVWDTTLTTYTYDGWNVIETREKTGAQTAEYVHGANVDEIVRAEIPASGGGTMMIYHHHDALGSVIALTDWQGAVVERYKYDVFGQPTFLDEFGTPLTTQRSAYGNNFLFTGREWLPLSGGYPPGSSTSSNPEPSSLPGGNQVGLYDYRNRAYTALLGRFMQTDPIRFDAGDANLYRYVGNRATGARDPMGLAEWHHLLPQSLFRHLNIEGIDIDSAEYGWMLDAANHRLAGGIHPAGWIPDWKVWLTGMEKSGRKLTKELVDEQLHVMKNDYETILGTGKKATTRFTGNKRFGKGLKGTTIKGAGAIAMLAWVLQSESDAQIAEQAGELLRELEKWENADHFSEKGAAAGNIGILAQQLFGASADLTAATMAK